MSAEKHGDASTTGNEGGFSHLPDGTFGVKLSASTQETLECVAGQDVHAINPIRTVKVDELKRDLEQKGAQSDFHPLRKSIEQTALAEAFIILHDSDQFLLCLSADSKMGFVRAQEEKVLALIDKRPHYTYRPPFPKAWESLGSDRDIEEAWVRDSRSKICLEIKRSVARVGGGQSCRLSDRNANAVSDGHVACLSQPPRRLFERRVRQMDRGVQAVPQMSDNHSQTHLKHPKNVAIQYEARTFTEDEVSQLWQSESMTAFLSKAEKIMMEVASQPDIMGEFRPEVEDFYRRDEVVDVEETKLRHTTFFTDLVFTKNMRVTHLRWHPTIVGVLALSAVENTSYGDYLNGLSKRLVMPNVLTVWSLAHPFFPQILLRVCDDVTSFEWHPIEPGTLIGGCMNGQLVLWDISEYVTKLKSGHSTWNHNTFLSSKQNKLHIADGFIPLLHWSAESDKDYSHLGAVESVQWLPKSVWFSSDSAYPKANQNDREVQAISCDCDGYVLIWALRKHQVDSMTESAAAEAAAVTTTTEPRIKSLSANWHKVKLQSALPASVTSTKKFSPAIGQYESLDKIWRPVHKIRFVVTAKDGEDEPLRALITSLCVIERPKDVQEDTSLIETAEKEEEEDEGGDDEEDLEEKEERRRRRMKERDQAQAALPTLLLAGTIFGAVFQVDLTKVRVDVDTNELICRVQWETSVHDGPVKIMCRSPLVKQLILTVGGYSWAVWRDLGLATPIVLHYVNECMFTSAAWSLDRPDIIYLSDEIGNVQVWQINARNSEPLQTQDISGRTINAVCTLALDNCPAESLSYLSVADESGTVHVLEVPRHLRESPKNTMDAVLQFMEDQTARKSGAQREEDAKGLEQQVLLDDDFESERHVEWEEKAYLKAYFRREKAVLEGVFGEPWKDHLKHPELPRKKYYVEEKRRDSSEERKRQKETLKAKKKKGGSIFRKY